MRIKKFDTIKELAIYFGQFLFEYINKREIINIALSGGSTPIAIFDELVKNYKDKINWNKINFYWVDERCVPPTDKDSNYKMTLDHLFSKIAINSENIHRVEGELSPITACHNYEDLLLGTLPNKNNLPHFNIVLLGMGDDGHTASIFPHQIKLWESENICKIAEHPTTGQKRITLTGNTINNADHIFFLVTGQAKAPILQEITLHKGNYESYPANLVDKEKTIWLTDKQAAK